jgi:hypothetical protein
MSTGARSSSVVLNNDGVYIDTTGTFSADCEAYSVATDSFTIQNAAKTKTVLEITEDYTRNNSDVQYCPNIIGNVVNTFPGGDIPWAGSIQASRNNIGSWLAGDAFLTVPAGVYTENLIFRNIHGSILYLTLSDGVHINGTLNILSCSTVYVNGSVSDGATITPTSSGDYVIKISACGYVRLYNFNVSGYAGRTTISNGTGNGIWIDEGSKVYLHTLQIDRTSEHAILVNAVSNVVVYNCRGGIIGGSSTDYTSVHNLGYAAYSMLGSSVRCDNFPASVSGNAYSAASLEATGSAQGSTGTTPAAPSTRTYAVSAGYNKKTESDGSERIVWVSGNPRQGIFGEWVSSGGGMIGGTYWADYNGFGLFILTNSANIVSDRPSGKTITAATFKFRRDSATGTSGAVTCTLYQHGLSTIANGIPNYQLFAQAADDDR